MIKYILFDCDGVLVDSEIIAAAVLLRQLEGFGFTMEMKPFLSQFAGMKDDEILAFLRQHHQVQIPDTFLHQLEVAIDEGLATELQAIKGVQQALDTISIPKAVVSNSELSRVQNSLRVAGISQHFGDRIFTATMAGRPKPNPDVYLYALDQLGLQPNEVVVVEDSITGVTAAHRAGLKVIGFVGASHITDGHADRLHQSGAFQIAENMERLALALPSLIEQA